jgi:hypothetical protein
MHNIFKLFIPLLCFSTVYFASATLSHADDEDQARQYALTVFNHFYSDDYYLSNTYYSGHIEEGTDLTFRFPVYKGNTYLVLAVGDAGVRDADIYTFDEDGAVWAIDNGSWRNAAVAKYANWTGYIYVVVRAAKGSGAVVILTGVK